MRCPVLTNIMFPENDPKILKNISNKRIPKNVACIDFISLQHLPRVFKIKNLPAANNQNFYKTRRR